MDDIEVREGVISFYEGEGYEVTDISKGSGVPKLTRLKLNNGAESLHVCIKRGAKHNGRIHFVREGEGRYKVLSEMDRVVWVFPVSDSAFDLLEFDAEVITTAFDRTFAELRKAGKEGYEIWLSPDFEDGIRFAGSGYRDKALRAETISLLDDKQSADSREALPSGTKSVAGILAKARRDISSCTGTTEENISLELRILS